MRDSKVKAHVKRKYGEIAQTGGSCCPECCLSATDTALQTGYSKDDLRDIPEASIMGLGCGNPVALAGLKEGETVLDLGSGAGIDVFLAAKKVGPKGKVIGVDMTKEMVVRARAAALERGYGNVEFRLGEIENLPVEDSSADIVISNCVINLSLDKERVFREAYRVLKPGGRIMISDLVSEGEMPDEIRRSLDAWAGCVAGALEKSLYLDTIRRAGFKAVKILSELTYGIGMSKAKGARVVSIQVEAFKTE